MKVYVARQPIFDADRRVFGYELLYRDSKTNRYNPDTDGSQATRAVLSDAITTFGLRNLTNGRYAFINFTRSLFLNDSALLLNPREFIIEILENVEVDKLVLGKMEELQKRGYKLALDDYTGRGWSERVIGCADIVKVDFRLTPPIVRTQIARDLGPGKCLLAEKVETESEYERAKMDGYTLFQGYYFAKPTVFAKSSTEITSSTYMRVLQEITRPTPNFERLATIIRLDVNMTYKLLHRINTLEYYRSHRVESIKHALVRMGMVEIRRWVLLVLMRDAVGKKSDEVVRIALVRGVFAEELAREIGHEEISEDAYNVGMFSMIDALVEGELATLLDELYISPSAKAAILGKNNRLGRILKFVCMYEAGDWDGIQAFMKEYHLRASKVTDLYLQAVRYADLAFTDSLVPPSSRWGNDLMK